MSRFSSFSASSDCIEPHAVSFTDLSKRRGDVAIVTGGSRGIGLEVVKKLLECDMHVVIACRRIQAGHNAIDALRRNGTTSGQTDVIQLDTSSMTSVRKFVDEFKTKIGKLHILINNGSVFPLFKHWDI